MPIFDQGYQHWSGELSGHAWRWLAIARHGVRVGMKNRFLRLVMLLAWLPAVGLVFALCVWGLHEQKSPLVAPIIAFFSFIPREIVENPKQFRTEIWTICYDYFLLTELRFSMILILLAGPSLISQDLRFNALPLYFSRPLRRIDYFMGKLGVIAWFLGMVLIVPSVIAYILGMAFSLDLSIIPDTFRLLLSSVAYGAVMTVSAGLFILALSSLSRNSRYVALFWLAVWFVSGIIGNILDNVNREQRMHDRYRQGMRAEAALQSKPPPKTAEEAQQARRARQDAWRKIQEEIAEEEVQAAKSDWRPMVSYTANLTRVGERMLGTNVALENISKVLPEEQRSEFLMHSMGPQYPWYWSAGVLAVLFGISVCILNFRVKSLDRLK
jgi:ABC-2 type transport system permease protein